MNNNKYPHLTSPIQLGKVTFRNLINVIVVNDYYLNKDKVADRVVVLGGGLAGCECAIHLGMEGKKVELV